MPPTRFAPSHIKNKIKSGWRVPWCRIQAEEKGKGSEMGRIVFLSEATDKQRVTGNWRQLSLSIGHSRFQDAGRKGTKVCQEYLLYFSEMLT
jgi:hypothetical protein